MHGWGHTNTDLCTWRFGPLQIFRYDDETGWRRVARPSEQEANMGGGKL